jgi:hypothetical protein
MEQRLSLVLGKGAVEDRDARIGGQPGLQRVLEPRPIRQVRLDGNDLPECPLCLLDEGLRHVAMMGAGIQKSFIVVQQVGDFWNKESIAIG